MAGARRSTLTRSDRVAVLERLEPGQVALRVGPLGRGDVLVPVHALPRPAARRGAVGDLVADRGVSRGGRPARPVGAAGPGGVGTLGAVIVDPVERGRLPGGTQSAARWGGRRRAAGPTARETGRRVGQRVMWAAAHLPSPRRAYVCLLLTSRWSLACRPHVASKAAIGNGDWVGRPT